MTGIQSAILGVIAIAPGTTVVAAQRQLSAALLAGVCTGTAGGTESPAKIAPSPGAAPAASAAKQCWAAIKRYGMVRKKTHQHHRFFVDAGRFPVVQTCQATFHHRLIQLVVRHHAGTLSVPPQ